MLEIDVDALKVGLPTMTPQLGGYISEAAAYCLEYSGHEAGVVASLTSSAESTMRLEWDSLDERAPMSHGDLQEATEYGAAAISILLGVQLTEYETVERSMKGEGFDYWLGIGTTDIDTPFQRSARLEVSGILNGNRSTVSSRVRAKHQQVSISDPTNYPAYVAVVEFGSPSAVFEKHA